MKTQSKKHIIQVRKYPVGHTHYTSDQFDDHGSILRVLRAECIGNFNPVFCTYKGGRTLVHSDNGDLSDPFRRDDNYIKALFIEIK